LVTFKLFVTEIFYSIIKPLGLFPLVT